MQSGTNIGGSQQVSQFYSVASSYVLVGLDELLPGGVVES